MMGVMANRPEKAEDEFIMRWQTAGGSERANYQSRSIIARKANPRAAFRHPPFRLSNPIPLARRATK